MNWRMMKSRMLEIKQCCWIHMIFLILAKRKWNLLILTRSWHFSFITMIIMVKNIKRVVKECQSDIDRLIGKTRIVVAERRNGDIGSCVFAKSSFSTQETTLNWRKTKNVREEVAYNMWYNHVNWCTQCTGVRGYHTLTF